MTTLLADMTNWTLLPIYWGGTAWSTAVSDVLRSGAVLWSENAIIRAIEKKVFCKAQTYQDICGTPMGKR